MKRVHFTAEDLARTRVATTIGVAAETFDTVKLLKDRDAATVAFRRRQVSVRGRLPATASHHAAVLRNARLITTRREGRAVLHTITSLGLALLERGRPLP
ncbi:helix-turn-helix domain-containing protein [Streptomyces panaciradicis]|uniref:helix-turn-helix domain-containing protein n=1 Tax=Streptomyces panaciradicis TaxID=1470261 RepID=UPI0027E50DD9|nr:helix-turn-helix domain-containing protein [Streptomyces panaciradicis]